MKNNKKVQSLIPPKHAPPSEFPVFINAPDLLAWELGCHLWSLNFFPSPSLFLLLLHSPPSHSNTKYSPSLLLEASCIYLITLLLTAITLIQTLITLFLEYCKTFNYPLSASPLCSPKCTNAFPKHNLVACYSSPHYPLMFPQCLNKKVHTLHCYF